MFGHQKLKCYQLGLELTKTIFSILGEWPEGIGDLRDQIRRAMSSVVLNIAEGNGRYSKKERKRFFNIATASASEVSAILDIAKTLRWIDPVDYLRCTDQLLQIVKMLYKLP